MEWQAVALVSLFSLLGLFCILLIPFGLPGLWMLLGFAVLVELGDTVVVPSPEETTFGWGLLAVCGGLGVVGEVIEAAAGAAGTRLGGGTRRGMWGAILGGLVGAVVFTLILPIPLVGTLVGALIGTFAGAYIAEVTGENAHQRATAENLRGAFAATVGRLAGTLGKLIIATVIWVLLVWNAFGL